MGNRAPSISTLKEALTLEEREHLARNLLRELRIVVDAVDVEVLPPVLLHIGEPQEASLLLEVRPGRLHQRIGTPDVAERAERFFGVEEVMVEVVPEGSERAARRMPWQCRVCGRPSR